MSLTQGDPLPNITTTQAQQTTAPSWYTDYLSSLAKGVGTATAGTGAATYAGTQDLQQKAFDATKSLQGATTPYLANAVQATGDIYKSDITAASVPGGQSHINQFMNPYTTGVVDALGTLGKRNIEQYLAPQATSGAVGSGQFGSKRGAEALGGAINTGLQNLNAVQSQALQSGYSEALRAAQAEQTAKLGAAQQYGNLAVAGQGVQLADINALATMGGQQQTIAQNKQLFPLQTANLGAQALRGYSIPTDVASTYTGPIPGAYAASPLQQIAGLGSIIAGASNTPLGSAIGTGFNKFIGGLSGGPYTGPGASTNDAGAISSPGSDPNSQQYNDYWDQFNP